MKPLLARVSALVPLILAACQTASVPFHSEQGDGVTGRQEAFQPTPPPVDKFDWIQLKSGEWLKGEIDGMRDGNLEFESDELDDLVLDMDDIVEIRSAGEVTILVVGREAFTGKLLMKDGKIQLVPAGKPAMVFDRSQMLALVPGLAKNGQNWTGKVSFGATLRSGNTDQTDLTSYVFARRDTAATRWDTKYNGAYSEVRGTTTTNNQRIDSRFDWYLTQRLFVTPLNLTWFRDPFQNIEYRLTAAAYVGYDIISESKISWEVSAGPAYQASKAQSSQPGAEDTDDTAAFVLGTNYEWDITGDVEFDLSYKITVPVPKTEDYNHHLQAMFSVDLIGSLELDISFIWDRINNPLTQSDGTTPKKDDYRTVIGIGFDF